MMEGLPCGRQDCRLAHTGSQSTLLYSPPVYDRSGNLIATEDPNTHWDTFFCQNCRKTFTKVTNRGVISWETSTHAED